MAGTDPPKNLLSLIRDFASEKSQGERRVVGLKKQIEELRSELDAANSELEEAKRLKETTEQELKGLEVELALNEASIQALEARIALIQEEISSVGSEIDELKNKEATSRDEFICLMVEFNTKIRKFQETFENKNIVGDAAEEGRKFLRKEVTSIASRTIKDQLAHIVSQIAKEEEEYLAEQNIQKQISTKVLLERHLRMIKWSENMQLQLELIDIERKVCLMDAMMPETKALEDLTRSELEKMCDSLSEELQKRCICPSCQSVNVEALGGILQTNDANEML